MNYSVLMSVYYKENPQFLKEAMESIYYQSLPTNDFVLVCDGPLTKELNNVILDMKVLFNDKLNVIRLEKNGGLGNALNIGIKHCKNEYVARMDSDDISFTNRCELQLHTMIDKNIDILSATIIEFNEIVNDSDIKRVLPKYHEEIVKFAKKRNPFNHPCVMYKKTSVESAGGYQDFYLLEDYYLWIRMIVNGAKTYNINDPLLYMRAGNGMYKRRSGIKHVKSQCHLFKYMSKIGFISKGEYLSSCIIRSVSSLLPNSLRKTMYKVFLRK